MMNPCQANEELIHDKLYGMVFIMLALLVFLPCQNTYSQQLSENAEEYNIRNFTEEVYIQTDRDIYITGEEVWLKVYTLNGLTFAPSDISKVVYIELLDKNNFPLEQLKIKVNNMSGSTVFILPDNISSGNYVLRAYTNWMKNWPVDQYCYSSISVINPFESIDHLRLPSDSILTGAARRKEILIPPGLSRIELTDKDGSQVAERFVYKQVNNTIKYSILLAKQEYSTRERVQVEISATDLEGNPVETDLSVSVAKSAITGSSENSILYSFGSNILNSITVAGISDSSVFYTIKEYKWDDEINTSEVSKDFIPELEGHLISGSIRSKTTGEPLRKTDISLSFVGKAARCRFGKTDENGNFNFIVNTSGLNEIVIQPLFPDQNGYYVELKQSFSNKFSDYKPSVFYLDSSKINEINNVIVSKQINNIYEPFRKNGRNIIPEERPDFFGKPSNTIRLSDYIELTTIREVVKEIIPNVYTLKQDAGYDFKLINKFRDQPFENKPLILVDGVPIYDFEKVLNINSKEVEWVDVLNTRYFFSEYVFDGIVSFITKKGNLSAMEFDNSVFRQVYETYQNPKNFYSPDYSTDIMQKSTIPDFRNTLYWNPDLHTGTDGKTELEFYTSDESLEYTIVVEGISPDGKTGFSTASLGVE